DQRQEHRHADRDAELEEELADRPLHERHRQEDGHDRQRRRDGREADLPGAEQRRLHARLAHLQVAVDVLEHDDSAIHDDPDRHSSVIRLIVNGGKPHSRMTKFRTKKVPTSEVGIDRQMLTVVPREPRKMKQTTPVKTMPRMSVSVSSSTFSRTYSEVSTGTC